jgi:hypothetical protein
MTDDLAVRERRIGGRMAALAVSTVIAAAGILPASTAHAAPGKVRTSTLVVKVLKGKHRLSGLRMCPYVENSLTERVGHCGKTNHHGVARLHHVQVGFINLVVYKKTGKILESVDGQRVKRRKVNRLTIQTHPTCQFGCT